MAVKVLSLAEVHESSVMSLIYGGPGVGKTITACGSQIFKTLIFDVDDGTSSARNWPKTKREMVDVIKVHSKVEFDEALKYLQANMTKYKLVVVDTMTELQWVFLTEVCKANNVIVARQSEWGAVLNMLMAITLAFKHLPIHVLFTAHEMRRDEVDLAGNTKSSFIPSFKGQYGADYAKHFSVVGRFFLIPKEVNTPDGKVETQYIRGIQFNKDPIAPDAKDRSQALKKYEDPDIDSILTRASAGLASLKTQPVIQTSK